MISAIKQNWIGLLAGFGIVLALFMGLYLRNIMSSLLFEKLLTLMCKLSIISTIWAVIEIYLLPYIIGKQVHRASAMFFYPNYFGTVAASIIIICAYKVLTRQGNIYFYYGIALLNVISLYLCKSMFAWVEVFLGVGVLLIGLKKHKLLAYWLFLATIASFIIFILNINVIPRLNEAELTTKMRVDIWKFAIREIKQSPIFGQGYMSYLFKDKNMHLGYLVPHSHSIILEFLMNFGIIGTVLFLYYIIKYYFDLIKYWLYYNKVQYTFVLAITAATIVHGLVDLTIMWVQTLPLLFIFMAGLGRDEPKKEFLLNE